MEKLWRKLVFASSDLRYYYRLLPLKKYFKYEKNRRLEKDRRLSNDFTKQFEPILNRG